MKELLMSFLALRNMKMYFLPFSIFMNPDRGILSSPADHATINHSCFPIFITSADCSIAIEFYLEVGKTHVELHPILEAFNHGFGIKVHK